MNKQSITGLVVIFLLLIGYSYWKAPSKEEIAKIEKGKYEAFRSQQQLDSVVRLERATADSLATVEAIKNPERVIDPNHPFSASLHGSDKTFTVNNGVLEATFGEKGGKIKQIILLNYSTYDSLPVVLFDERYTKFSAGFFAQNRMINTEDCYFECNILGVGGNSTESNVTASSSNLTESNVTASSSNLTESNVTASGSNVTVGSGDSVTVSMRLYPNGVTDRYFEFLYTIYEGQYMMGFKINVAGLQDIIAANTTFIDLTWNEQIQQIEKALQVERQNTALFYKPTNDDVDNLSETRSEEERLTTPLRWISFKQQFFNVTLIANNNFLNADVKSVEPANKQALHVKDLGATIGIPYQADHKQSVDMRIYAGPNKYNIVKQYDLDMERIIPLGWGFFLMQWINRFAVIPVFDLLERWAINYGIIILILTILLKIVLSPITYRSYLSSAKMRVLQPEVEQINKKFPKKEQAMEKQKAVMALYKKAGASPMSGCIPMLLQFPILIAMFRFFPASIELRQKSFLWATDLSSYDSILNLPFTIPFYGDHVSLFALLMAISNLLYTRMTMKQQSSTNAMPGMKWMMYLMPIMFLGFLNSYSSALNYYYFISTCFTFFQMWLIRQFVDDKKIHAKIQENKKKPVKVSSFQKRLEAMAKRQQEIAKNAGRR
ncbi:MAG: membrane protein insertase YidC [Bacteroidales bacterium]|jgi:YidC/Oxa1 family membrane protein insertase|nr:membrane protein insertase YidC [Bacteroidales bacterium]